DLGIGPLRAHPLEHRPQIFRFAIAVVECALRGADAAEVEPHRAGTAQMERARGHRDDLVVHRPALGRQRVADDADQWPRGDVGLGPFDDRLDRAGGTGEGQRHGLAGAVVVAGGECGLAHPGMIRPGVNTLWGGPRSRAWRTAPGTRNAAPGDGVSDGVLRLVTAGCRASSRPWR